MICLPPLQIVGGMRVVSRMAQPFQDDLQLAFSGQGKSAGAAPFEADLASGEAANGMRHNGLPGLGVPFKNVVRAEV